MRLKLVSAFTGCLLAFGCASSNTIEIAPVDTPEGKSAGIGAQDLAPGECGLFLWTVAEPRELTFFSKAGTQSALADFGGDTQSLTLTDASGELFGQFMTSMNFDITGGGGSMTLSIEAGELIDQGQRTKAARLLFVDADGWETIVPVAGVRACQSE